LRAGAISVADGIGDEGGPDRCALGLLRLLLDEVRPARQHAAPRSQTDARSLLGVTGATRAPQLPEVPTLGEAGVPGFEHASARMRLVAPAGTPPAVIERLNAAFQEVLNDPALQRRIIEIGAVPVGGTATAAAAELRDETARLAS